MSRSADRQKRYTPFLLGGLLILNLILMAATARQNGTEQTVLRAWTLAITTPIQSGVGAVFSGIGSLWTGYVDLRGVRDRNAHLEVENAQLRSEIEAARLLAAENERMRKVLDLAPRLKYPSVAAEVVSRDATAWFKRVTINKGTLSGIERNQPVVTPDGLVGRVIAVGPNAAQIQLITDEHAGVGGRLTSSSALGEIKGKGDGTCRLMSISSLQNVELQDAVLTSGLDRIYPAGILIGYVESVTPGAGASPHDITVRTAAPLDRIQEVMVLQVDPRDLTMTETIKP